MRSCRDYGGTQRSNSAIFSSRMPVMSGSFQINEVLARNSLKGTQSPRSRLDLGLFQMKLWVPLTQPEVKTLKAFKKISQFGGIHWYPDQALSRLRSYLDRVQQLTGTACTASDGCLRRRGDSISSYSSVVDDCRLVKSDHLRSTRGMPWTMR